MTRRARTLRAGQADPGRPSDRERELYAKITKGATLKHDAQAIQELADQLAVYASPTRLSIAVSLTNAPGGEMAVHQLAEVVAVSFSGLSQHLAKMKAHGLVIGRRQAQAVFYRLAPGRPATAAVLGLLEGV